MDQYWNAYSYCGADPVNTVDEWGLEGEDNGDDDGDGTPNQNDQDQNPGYDSYHGGTFYATVPNTDVSNSVPSGPGSPGSPNGPSGPGFDPNWLKKPFERQQAEYPNGSIQSDPLFNPFGLAAGVIKLSVKTGQTIVKAGDDVVEEVIENGKKAVDDAIDAGKKIAKKKSVRQKGIGGKGWRGDKNWKKAVKDVSEGGTINKVNGEVVTEAEALDLLKEAKCVFKRAEDAHAPPNPHNFPHINYETQNGVKGTIQVQGVK